MSAKDLETGGDEVKTAWVVFTGQTDRPWLRCLRAGFRHCFVIINDGQRWLSFDPMMNYTDIRVHHHIPPTFDLPSYFTTRDYHVAQASICAQPKRPAPLAMMTCVEAVKRILGLHAWHVMTPWQLYRYLTEQ